MVYVPEWRAVTFDVKTGYVDACKWIQYNLRGRYGGDIGVIRITSSDCFNNSKALRVAYQPYHYYLAKYIKVVVRIEIDGVKLERNLTGGGELTIPSSRGPYGEVKTFTIEVTGPQDSYLLHPMEYVTYIAIVPPSITYRGLAGTVVTTYYNPPFTVLEILLNDTVTPDGLYIHFNPAPPPYMYCEVKSPNRLLLYLLTPTADIVQGSLTVIYSGPGLVKQGEVPIPPTPTQPAMLTEIRGPVKVTYFPIRLTQPQPLLSVVASTLNGTVATYLELNMSITPRDPYMPITISPLVFVNKSGVLTPLPPGVLRNSTNSGVYQTYLNGTVQLRWLIPTPPGESLVVYIYGDNVAEYKISNGRVYILTTQAEEKQQSSTLSPTQIVSIAIMTAGAATFCVLYIITERRP